MTRFMPRQIQWIPPILQKNVKIFRPNLETPKNEENSNQNLQIQTAAVTSQDNSLRPISQPVQSIYSKYACFQGNPLSCEWSQKTTEELTPQKYCLNCQFPTLLPAGMIVKSYRDSYQIDPRDNRSEPVGQKFAEIVNTIKVQNLLQQTGLVPAQPLN